jgi:hypothetical protein
MLKNLLEIYHKLKIYFFLATITIFNVGNPNYFTKKNFKLKKGIIINYIKIKKYLSILGNFQI